MAFLGLGGGAGVSSTYDTQGLGITSYDSGAALQQRLAKEQWGMQKDIYGRQIAAAGQVGESLTGLVDQYNTAYGEARAANEERYQQIIGISDATVDQRSADIQGAYGNRQADVLQRLARTGLSNTTIAPTMTAGIERDKQAALDRSKQEFAAQRIGVRERREDEYPSSDIIMALVNQFSQGGGGVGAGGIAKALGNLRLG